MGSNGNGNGNRGFDNKLTLTRRDFLKTTAAATAAGGLLEVAGKATPALSVENPSPTDPDSTWMTTCLCCSVGCGQLVDVKDGAVTDIYGDPNHVVNAAGNCPKGAAAILNVKGDRRLGTPDTAVTLPGMAGTASAGPWYRDGTGAWTQAAGATAELRWNAAMTDIATKMKTARTTYDTANADVLPTNIPGKSNNGVAFLGCSHATDEENYLYRKIIANFGSNNTEHQARI
jgi:formate dehydrogenase major subunit